LPSICKTPTTCVAENAQCGSLDDKCNGTLDCGTCAGGGTCVSNKCVGGTGGDGGPDQDGGSNGDTAGSNSGCGCHTIASRFTPPWALFGLCAAAIVGVWRRRRRA
jgi:hypothetical protein